MPRPLRHLMIWTAICGIAAAPSFVLALVEFNNASQVLAMLAGIACFIFMYALISCTSWAIRFRRRPFVFTTMKVGYGTRMLISASTLLAIGRDDLFFTLIPDLYAGIVSLAIVTELLSSREDTPAMIFLTTIVEGLLWNIALFIYMAIIYIAQLLTRKKPSPVNHCATCGYDLRANTTGICPECGTHIAETAVPPASTIHQ